VRSNECAHSPQSLTSSAAVYVLGPLQQGSNYVTPQKNSSSQKCQCNTVMFRCVAEPYAERSVVDKSRSLYMACTACQNITTQAWSFWSQFCPEVYIIQYPQVIPIGTAVPHWAYLNYTVGVQGRRQVAVNIPILILSI
jgi:hypothetical protein